MAKIMPATRQTNAYTRVNDASRILKRFYIAERQLMRTLAAWFVQTSQWDLKQKLSGHMWQASVHADKLRTRVLELRYPRRDVDRKYDSDVLDFLAEAAKANDFQEFMAGIYEVVVPGLITDYESYLERADDLDDAPTIYILRHVLLDKRAQIEEMQNLAQDVLPQRSESVQQWCDYLHQYLASIGGFGGLSEKSDPPTDHVCAGRPEYQIPNQVQRDSRWRPALFHLPHENKYDIDGRKAWQRIEALDKRVAMQVWSAISHFNEIWAAEVPCAVIWALGKEPWGFYMDLARWAWDETRHSVMGYRALQSWGFDIPELIPWGNALYNALGNMPAQQRLALLYYYEEGLLRSGTKQIEIQILESAQDEGSTQDMDYDWADEAMHVNYGYTWLRHLLGDDQAGREELARLTDEAREAMAAFVKNNQDVPEAKLAPYYDRLREVIADMLIEIPDDDLDVHWQPIVADEEALENPL